MHRIANHDRAAAHRGADTQPGLRGKVRDCAELQSSFFGGNDDCVRERMFGLAFDGRGKREHVVLSDRADRLDRDQLGLAFRERTRLVDDKGIDLFQPL